MSVLVLLITAGGVVASGFMLAFIWAVRSGQFDDTCTPAVRMLLEAAAPPPVSSDTVTHHSPPSDAGRVFSPASDVGRVFRPASEAGSEDPAYRYPLSPEP